MVQISSSVLPDFPSFLFFTTLVLWWAIMRPVMVRDYDNRHLVANPIARIIFAVLCLALYAAIVVAFLASGKADAAFIKKIAFLGTVKELFRDQAPLLAVFTLGSLMQLAMFRDIERSVLVWLHAARDLHVDRHELAMHLTKARFKPNAEEQFKNRETAAQHGVFVDEASKAAVLVTFVNWRKVASLLRLVRQWNNDEKRILTRENMDELAVLEESHERKTKLALNIVKMVEPPGDGSVQKGFDPIEGVEPALASAASAASVEAQMSEILATDVEGSEGSRLFLSGGEFAKQLRQIESYFRQEYETLLDNVSQLAAKSVVRSGDAAPKRLETLKTAGFAGLGRIERINLDRILWFFIFVSLGGFLVLFLGNFGEKYSPIGWDALARLTFIMTIATLIGAIVGSARNTSANAATPWTKYFGAGLLAAVGFFALQSGMSALVKGYIEQSRQEQSQPMSESKAAAAGSVETGATSAAPPSSSKQPGAGEAGNSTPSGTGAGKKKRKSAFNIHRALPWVFLPFFVAVAICRLGQLAAWPKIPGLGKHHHIVERVLDGLVVSVVVYFAYVLTIAVHEPLGLNLSKRFMRSIAEPHFPPIPIRWPIEIMSFLVGFVVVRDVRRAAHAKILANPPPSEVVVQEPA